MTAKRPDGLFPIRTVASVTGVNPITLRAWERRYGLIRPQRTAKGHRLYTQDDIDLIQRVTDLLEKGIPISQVQEQLKADTATATGGTEDLWVQYQRRMLHAVGRFNTQALEQLYNEVLSLYPVDMVTSHLIVPLLKTLGERWEQAEGSVAEEHFFSAYLRNKLGARFHHRTPRARGPVLVAACLPGEQHEIGLMLFSLSALERDFRVVLLGADIPLDEIPSPVHKTQARGIILSGSIEPRNTVLERDLPTLVNTTGVPVLVGGHTAVRHRDRIVRAGAIPAGTDIAQGIRRLGELLGSEAAALSGD